MQDHIESLISHIRPVLKIQGRDIQIRSASPDKIEVALLGFCGDCGCSADYSEGIQELLTNNFPDVKEILIVKA